VLTYVTNISLSLGPQGIQDFGHAGCGVIAQLMPFKQDALTFQFREHDGWGWHGNTRLSTGDD
jgi:hypothetical protein